MKKIVLIVFALIAVAFVFTACDKDEQVIPNEQLPEAATAFVNEYFAGAKIISSIKDKEGSTHEYEVKLDNGVDIKFDKQWKLDWMWRLEMIRKRCLTRVLSCLLSLVMCRSIMLQQQLTALRRNLMVLM